MRRGMGGDLREKLSRCLGNHLSTIRSKVIVLVLPGLLITSIVYTAGSVMMQQTMVREEMAKRAKVVSGMISLVAELPLLSRKPGQIEGMAECIGNVPEVASVSVYDTGRSVLEGKKWQIRHEPAGNVTTMFEERDHYDIYIPVFHESAMDGIGLAGEARWPGGRKELLGWVRIAFSKEYIDESRAHFIMRSLMIALFFTGASGMIVYFLFSYATRPLAQLSGAAKSIRNGHYPKIKVSSRDEVSEIACEFNRMSEALNRREEMLVARAKLSEFSAEVGMALTESENLAEMSRACAEVCRAHTDSICVGIWLCNAHDDALQLQASAGLFAGNPFPARRLSPGEASAGFIAQERQPFASKNPAELPYFNNRDFMTANDIRFFAGYPVIVESRLIGVVELYARQPFCWDVLNAIDTLSDQMAVGFERKVIEERMSASLEEKEVLLREIHHRVKNNMQVISSLLNLQAQNVSDPKYQEMFNESKNRIRAMALIHEKLYQRPDIANIDFGDYIESLANGLFMFYGISTSQVVLRIDAEGIVLGIDTAIPCGLIINELLSNALKYAFPHGEGGEIGISMKKMSAIETGGEVYTLTVSDNGIGLPEGFDIRIARSLGLHLVTSLAEHQLQGSMEVSKEKGTTFRIHFRDAGHRKKG
jgi:two-component sensor histidine kinase/HAMP domain-containing protein